VSKQAELTTSLEDILRLAARSFTLRTTQTSVADLQNMRSLGDCLVFALPFF
jgi:hypothetical protein